MTDSTESGRDHAHLVQPCSYVLVPSRLGAVGIVWKETQGHPLVLHVYLPCEHAEAERVVQDQFPGSRPLSCLAIANLGAQVQSFLQGDPIRFRLRLLDLERCSGFQKKVLLAESEIPRGWVSTYGRIASELGVPGAARAVGGALARNPFPIIIPCHRAVRSNGDLGGFQGGLNMKRALLEMEGVKFTRTGRIMMRRVYYPVVHRTDS
jgi:methylated-DNA-[protein]-cysteine S-methyltransferase